MDSILVVDDDSAIRRILNDKLTKEGFEVMEARDGVEALAQMRKKTPDLIMLDILMTKMDGKEFLDEMRKEETYENVKVIILSNVSDQLQIQEFMDRGVFDYLLKTDWSLDEVVAKVRKILSE